MKTQILLGIIAVTILGTLSIQHIFVQAGMIPIETIQVLGNLATADTTNQPFVSTAQCPDTHPYLIGGDYSFAPLDASVGRYSIIPSFETNDNFYRVDGLLNSGIGFQFLAIALCANFNFPMMAVGGEWLPVDNFSLLLVYATVNAEWMLPATIGVIGVGIYLVKRRF